jgi:hypothetical protein
MSIVVTAPFVAGELTPRLTIKAWLVFASSATSTVTGVGRRIVRRAAPLAASSIVTTCRV